MNHTYLTLAQAFAKIGIKFRISIDPEEANKIKYECNYDLINPWNFPNGIRGKVVAAPLVGSFFDPSTLVDELIEKLSSDGISIQRWNRNNTEIRKQEHYMLDKEKLAFLAPNVTTINNLLINN
ncbi:hypothetical protein KBC03_00435 [Patescibacteria group bacterium]|nr:hypothetical protein [Patescibacteria group bacterium]